MKKCQNCGIEKEANQVNFHRKRTGKDGYDSICKACKRERDQKYYFDNKEKISRQKAKYYQKKLSMN